MEEGRTVWREKRGGRGGRGREEGEKNNRMNQTTLPYVNL